MKMFTLWQSKMYHQQILEMFYNELETFFRSHRYVCIHGDFNAHSADLSDITITDDDILKQLGLDSEIIYSSDNTDILKKFDLDIIRVSKDKNSKHVWKKFGRFLLK